MMEKELVVIDGDQFSKLFDEYFKDGPLGDLVIENYMVTSEVNITSNVSIPNLTLKNIVFEHNVYINNAYISNNLKLEVTCKSWFMISNVKVENQTSISGVYKDFSISGGKYNFVGLSRIESELFIIKRYNGSTPYNIDDLWINNPDAKSFNLYIQDYPSKNEKKSKVKIISISDQFSEGSTLEIVNIGFEKINFNFRNKGRIRLYGIFSSITLGRFEIANSHLGDFVITDSELGEFDIFVSHTSLEDLIIINSSFPKVSNFKRSNNTSEKTASLLGQIATAFKRGDDLALSNKYSAAYLTEKYKLLSWGDDFSSKIILLFNRIVSNHGTSWLRALLSLLFISTISYAVYIRLLSNSFDSYQVSVWDHLFLYFEYLNPLHNSDFIIRRIGLSYKDLPTYIIAIDNLSRIIIGVLVYQLLISFRKFTIK